MFVLHLSRHEQQRVNYLTISTRNCGKRKVQLLENEEGGNTTNEGNWPWIAAIYHVSHDTHDFKCSGTLIHPRIILTSAMCVFNGSRQVVARRVRAELGKFDLTKTGYNVDQYQVIECVIWFAKIDDECTSI